MNERGEENFTPNYTGKFFDESSGLYYFNARWYDCELGRFTTQDPARDGANWWIYCGGNPITFVDPDGREILPITSRQYQNSVLNKDLNVGSEKTGFYNRQNNYVTNTIGRFGCLFVCAVNVGNSYNQINSANYSEQQVSSLAKNDDYFDFFLSRDVLGTDFVSGPKHIGMLLADMTGKEFNVMRVSHKNITELSIEAINSDSSKSSYIIADVGGHFINITGIDSEGNISYFDPYIRSTKKDYSMNDIKGAYFIMEMEAYNKLGEQNEMEN